MKIQFAAAMTAVAVLAFTGTAYSGGHNFKDADFKAELLGASEVPPVVTDTNGEAKFNVIDEETALRFEIEIEDAVGILGATGAHIHCAPAGSNGPIVIFLAGDFTGGYDGKVEIKGTVDADNIIGVDCGADISQIVDAMEAGDAYVNVHSTGNPGGEVRGQIVAD